MDLNALTMLAAVGSHPAASLLCPDYLQADLAAQHPAAQVVPYCAASLLDDAIPDTAILHKGQLWQLGRRFLRILRAEAHPVFANEVFVVFRAGPANPAAPHPDPVHLSALEAFIHHAQVSGTGVVVSAWGAGNIGDDAVTLAAGLMARAAGCDAVIHAGPQGRPDSLPDARLVIVGGGGLLYDSDYRGQPDYANAGNYTAPLHIAARHGVPCAVLGVGVQGIRTAAGRAAFAAALRRADLVTVRDAEDQRILREELGLRRVHLSADLAFALPRLAGWTTPAESRAGRPRAVISLAASMGGFARQGAAFGTFLRGLVAALGRSHAVVLARHSVDDAAPYAEVAAATGASCLALDEAGVDAALDLYRSADLVVTSRYHGLIFGALGGARLAPVADRAGKIGRLIATRLPSLEAATTYVSGPLGVAPGAVAAKAARVDPAELEACIAAAHADLARLRALF